jgi:hypothetical protein
MNYSDSGSKRGEEKPHGERIRDKYGYKKEEGDS